MICYHDMIITWSLFEGFGAIAVDLSGWFLLDGVARASLLDGKCASEHLERLQLTCPVGSEMIGISDGEIDNDST